MLDLQTARAIRNAVCKKTDYEISLREAMTVEAIPTSSEKGGLNIWALQKEDFTILILVKIDEMMGLYATEVRTVPWQSN